MAKKLTQEYVREYYLKNDYILNSIYNGNKNDDKLTCPVGHNIEMRFSSFKSGNRCKICFFKTKTVPHNTVYNYYKQYGYTLNSIYKNNRIKDRITCPKGHNIEISFNGFKKGNRCVKCFGNEKHSHEYVYNYYFKEKYVMNSIYKNSKTKDLLICPNGHEIEMCFGDFKKDHRCLICSGFKKHSHEYIYNYYADYKYTLNSIYKGNKYKDQLTCPVGHNIEMRFDGFKKGSRCQKCFFENNTGENHSNFNPTRECLYLNQRLRDPHPKSWIIKYMKDDLKYNNFLLNSDDYVIDHIIPVKLFCELFTKYTLDEPQVKKIVNQMSNLQLLTKEENWNKSTKGSSLFEATNYLINNGITFETFLEENIV